MADTQGPEIPEAVAQPKRRWHVQIVWLIPLVALLIGGWIAIHAILERGPTITVTFKSAEGVEAGKTKFKYKDVDIGQVTAVSVSRDLQHVIVTAELARELKPHLVEDTRFWVVRPRIAGGSVSGLGTLLAGSYIAVDRGTSTKERLHYVGLDEPPAIQRDRPGREYVLHSANAGSHGIGSPIFFRQLKVGEVTGARLADDGKSIVTNIFVDQQYVQYVDANSRFWNASGIDIKLDASGVRIDTQSLASILIGGIAFDSPHDAPTGAPVAAHTNFHLFVDRSSAMKNPETEVMKFALVFRETVRGLLPGAPVALRGVDIGEVIDVGLDVDVDSHIVVTRVTANLYPSRVHFHSRKPSVGAQRVKLIDDLVAHGMRAQLRPASLVTGQLFVALDFFSPQPKERVDWAANPPLMPTTPGNLQEIQTMLSSVAAKLDKLPLDEISKELRATIATANGMIRRLDAEVAPEARETLAQARKALGSVDRLLSNGQPATQEARDTMREVGRAAQSLRVLADYLERHPESLIRGKQEDQK